MFSIHELTTLFTSSLDNNSLCSSFFCIFHERYFVGGIPMSNQEEKKTYRSWVEQKEPRHLSYVTGIAATLNTKDKPEGEQLTLLLDNVWNEIASTVIELSTYKESSRPIEVLIWNSSPKHFDIFIDSMARMYEENIGIVQLATNPFGCYVIDALYWKLITLFSTQAKEVKELMKKLVNCYGNLRRDDLINIIYNKFGSFALRHILQVLAGLSPDPAPKIPDKRIQILPIDSKSLKKQAHKLLKEITAKIENTENSEWGAEVNLNSMSYDMAASPFLSQILSITDFLNKDKLLDRLIRLYFGDMYVESTDTKNAMDVVEVGDQSETQIKFFKFIKNQKASHSVELIFQIFGKKDPDMLNQFYQHYFRGHLLQLVKHPVSNFVVQKLIVCFTLDNSNIPVTEKVILQIFEELSKNEGNFNELINGRQGVILALEKAASVQKNADIQRKILDALIQSISFKTSIPVDTVRESFVKYLISLDNSPKVIYRKKKFAGKQSKQGEEEQEPELQQEQPQLLSKGVTNLGCQLLSELFNFDSTVVGDTIVPSFLGLEQKLLVDLCNHHEGSAMVELYCDSPNVHIRHKLKLMDVLRGTFATLSFDPRGSRCVEKFYSIANVPHKEKIVKEILPHSQQLNELKHGAFVMRNIKLSLYNTNKKAWKVAEKKTISKQDTFKDLVELDVDPKKKKLKPLKDEDSEDDDDDDDEDGGKRKKDKKRKSDKKKKEKSSSSTTTSTTTTPNQSDKKRKRKSSERDDGGADSKEEEEKPSKRQKRKHKHDNDDDDGEGDGEKTPKKSSTPQQSNPTTPTSTSSTTTTNSQNTTPATPKPVPKGQSAILASLGFTTKGRLKNNFDD
eukprot:TRINITY_DN456_c0_g1_i6.p1 TRINITY_DN456_c0_g1~~TRINITY_DN456_c0_g1_i6.p1  ORF type:complete len:849 (+),score=202.67 TRINITY_DN456_c0_g1_i6:526-3072(+)